jgi:hypothetical protein
VYILTATGAEWVNVVRRAFHVSVGANLAANVSQVQLALFFSSDVDARGSLRVVWDVALAEGLHFDHVAVCVGVDFTLAHRSLCGINLA